MPQKLIPAAPTQEADFDLDVLDRALRALGLLDDSDAPLRHQLQLLGPGLLAGSAAAATPGESAATGKVLPSQLEQAAQEERLSEFVDKILKIPTGGDEGRKVADRLLQHAGQDTIAALGNQLSGALRQWLRGEDARPAALDTGAEGVLALPGHVIRWLRSLGKGE